MMAIGDFGAGLSHAEFPQESDVRILRLVGLFFPVISVAKL